MLSSKVRAYQHDYIITKLQIPYLQCEINNAFFYGGIRHFLEPAQFEPQQHIGGSEIHSCQRNCNIHTYASWFVCHALCGLLSSFA